MHREQSLEQDLDQERKRFGWMKSNASVSRGLNVFRSQIAEQSLFGFLFLKGFEVLLLPPGLDANSSDVRREALGSTVLWNCSTALQRSQKENINRIPFTLTFHPHNHAVKSIILKNFKILQNDPDTCRIFSQPPLISFKRDKNMGNFLVRSAFQTSEQPGTFKCARARCKTCPFICNVEKLSGPKRSIKITDHFTCTSANVIYCITCTLCKKLYIGETGRRLGDSENRRPTPRTSSRRRERRQKRI